MRSSDGMTPQMLTMPLRRPERALPKLPIAELKLKNWAVVMNAMPEVWESSISDIA